MICTRCKKRQAVVFITTMNGNEKKNEGLCLICARKAGISQVDDYMKQMGISEEDLEALCPEIDSDGDSFEPGGTGSIPGFISNFFNKFNGGGAEQRPESAERETQKRQRNKQPEGDKGKRELRFLGTYCTDLNARAAEGKMDRIVGREREIGRVIQILSRRQKNNPCLIGEPGVGKTAIAEGIAQKIVSGDVPYHLKGKRIFLLDLTALVAGTQFRGQFESRIKGLIEEVKREGNVILFIDEVHSLVGTGDAEGTMNAANILKPALSRGEVQVIGATTFKEYRKYIEKDSALERRFQPVTVTEPTVEETVQVLMGIRKYYEEYHHVKISDAALRMCAVLSERYINDRFLPDKAIDLLDEACASASIRSPELGEYAELQTSVKELEDAIAEQEKAETPDYEQIANERAELSRLQNRMTEIRPVVDSVTVNEEDLSKVIELWTGIPANKIVESEYEKIRNLHDALSKRIVGQPEAVDLVCAAIKRSRVQLTERKRPASFIFVGPTGVGKTELAKTLAAELFDATETLAYALRQLGYQVDLDDSLTKKMADYFKTVRDDFIKDGTLMPKSMATDTQCLTYQVPGGMLSNLLSQLKQMNALDRFDEALVETPKVRKDMGYPPLVTPTSQMVGVQAVRNVLDGQRYKTVSKEIKAYCRGEYGRTPAPIDPEIQAKILGDEKPLTGRYADTLKPIVEETRQKLAGVARSDEDVLSYIAFPNLAEKFFAERKEKEENTATYTIVEA